MPRTGSSARILVRNRLFLTTALISVASISSLPGRAAADFYLNNAPVGGVIGVADGTWERNSSIWRDTDTGLDGTLPVSAIGIIRAAEAQDFRLTLSDDNGPVFAGGIHVERGIARLSGSAINSFGGATLSFSAAQGQRLVIASQIMGSVDIPAQAFAVSATDVTLYGRVDGDVTNAGGLWVAEGIDGDLDNTGTLRLGRDGGQVVVTGDMTNAGTTEIIADTTVDTIHNQAGGALNLAAGRLEVEDEFFLEDYGFLNEGTVAMGGADAVIASDVQNNGLIEGAGQIIGSVTNTDRIQATGDLSIENVENLGTVAVTATGRLSSTNSIRNDGTMTIDGTVAGRVNNGSDDANAFVRVNAGGTIDGDLDNRGQVEIAGAVTGLVQNRNGLTTTGDAEVGDITTLTGGTTTIAAGTTLTSDIRAKNDGGRTDINGTLSGDLLNLSGSVDLAASGTVAGDVENRGTLTSVGRIDGDLLNSGTATSTGAVTGAVSNQGTLDIGGTVGGTMGNRGNLTTRGDLSVGLFDNNDGTATVRAGDTMTAAGGIDNDAELIVNGAVVVSDGSELLNRRNATTVFDGAQITADITNNGDIDVDASSTIDGSLTNNSQLTLDGANGDVTLGVSGTFTNNGRVDGRNTNPGGTASALLIDAGQVVVGAGGQVRNVNVRGGILNYSELTYDEDAYVEGNLVNETSGEVTVSAQLDMRGNDVTNKGEFDLVEDSNSSGQLTAVDRLVNSGDFSTLGGTTVAAVNVANIQSDGQTGVMQIGGTLTVDEQLSNSAQLSVSGRVNGDLRNTGTAEMAGGTLNGDVLNDGTMLGSGTITGPLNNIGQASIGGRVTGGIANGASGTLTSAGTLSTASLVNAGTVQVADGSSLQSDTAVQNNNRLIVTGQLASDLVNAATTTLNGGTITGEVSNTADGMIGGQGTIDGDLTNTGEARFGGRVTGALSNDGTLVSDGTLRVARLTNGGVVDVADNSVLVADNAIANNGMLSLAGQIRGDVNNADRTVMEGGTLVGDIVNQSSLTGSGTIQGTLINNATARISGEVDVLRNNATLGLTGALSVDTLINDGTAAVAAGRDLTASNSVTNRNELTVSGRLNGDLKNEGLTRLSGGSITGTVLNSGDLRGEGALSGAVINDGDILTSGAMLVGQLTNNGITTIAADTQLSSDQDVINEGALSIKGTLAADLENRTDGRTELTAGLVQGDIRNAGALTGRGRVQGVLTNTGDARIGGVVTEIQNEEDGFLRAVDSLTATRLVNAGEMRLAEDATLTVPEPLGAAGDVAANARNLETGLMVLNGTLDGSLINDGTVRGSGTIDGSVQNAGMVTWSGTITGVLDNIGGRFVVADAARVEDEIVNGAGARMAVQRDGILSADSGVTNLSGGDLSVFGTLDGDVVSNGDTQIAGVVTGDVDYRGGSLSIAEDARIASTLRLNNNYAIGPSAAVTAARTAVAEDVTLDLSGRLNSRVTNNGTVLARGQTARVDGVLVNNGLVSTRDGDPSGVFRVGGLAGNGTYRLDVDPDTRTADRIVVSGGAATGAYYLDFGSENWATVIQSGMRLTLLDVDEDQGSANDYTFTHSDLPVGSERIVYSVQKASQYGDLNLISQTNPAMGAIFGNVALVQSLIGSVINRPTSPFTTALAFEDTERPCGVGSWGRAIGGHANATGSTNNGVSDVATSVNANYYGMQVGTDFACFDDRFGGWNMTFGVLGGINRGDTDQPVYAIDPGNAEQLSGVLTSYTSSDFEQRYAGLYATATKGRFQADLQYRVEKTDFTISNDPVSDQAGLGLNDAEFSSDGQTLSGSVSYVYPVGEKGWAILPTVGFAWSKMSTDAITFEDGYELRFDDSTRKIGFVGATVARSIVQPERNSALYAFATGTWYRDFADQTVSTFAAIEDDGFEDEVLRSENLGSYGEISVGANWVKVLGQKARGRQFSAGARIDARFGDQLDSVGVSGQVRWQF